MLESSAEKRDRTLSTDSDRSETDLDPHFEPIITLPEVKIATNEESEVVMLKLRAKLYRFDTSSDDGPEWKERGTGEVKLLHNNENNTVRVVMRRDKTLKVCANHFITPFMELKPSTGSDKAFVYTVPADFADQEIKAECLAIKFGSIEFANLFKEKFYEGKNIVATKCKLYIDGEEDDGEEDDGEEDDGEEDDGEEDVSKEAKSKDISSEDVENSVKKDDEILSKLESLNVSHEDDASNK